jgi:hypothetical protein
MPHGHPQGWAPKEIGAFVDQHLTNGKPLPRLGEMKVSGGGVEAAVTSESKVAKAGLHYTTDVTTTWNKREWKSADATVKDGKAVAELPAGRPLVVFLTVTDERGLTVSTEHRIVDR